MRIFLFLLNILLLSVTGYAQQGFTYSTADYTTPLGATINMSDNARDFDPKLLLIKPGAPEPLSGTKKMKQSLDRQRIAFTHNRHHSGGYSKTTAASPSVLSNFLGNATQGTPNDNDLAISNAGIVVSVVNTNLNIYNDTGKYLGGKSLAVFANVLGSLNRTYDPRVIYDPKQDRFILVFLQGSTSADTRIIVAFSQSNDPTQKWNFYVIPGNVTGDSSWSDYPILSLTDNELFITVNRVKDNTPWQQGFITSYIWQIDKQRGYSAETINEKLYKDIVYNGKSIWNICPVKGGSTTYAPGMFFLSQRPSDLQNDTVFLHQITNTNASGNASLTQKVLTTTITYGLQPNAIQPNGKKLQTNDSRILSAMYENGYIHYVGNTIDTSLFAPGVYYGRVGNVFGDVPAIEGMIISYDSMDIGYPSISYMGGGSGDNSVLITFSHVSPNHFPGTSVVYADRFGNLSAPVFVKKGLSSIDILGDSVDRWGDYTGNQRKYNEQGVCWINGSFGDDQGRNRTWIAKIQSNDPLLGIKEQRNKPVQTFIYPNPSNDIMHIDFTMAQTQWVEFEVMDIQGKLVSRLLRDKAKAGLNRFSLNVSDMSSGTYFLVIKQNNEILQNTKFVVKH